MSDTEQLAILTLVDARGTILTRVWTGRDDDYSYDFPLCTTRETAQGYAEVSYRANHHYPDDPEPVLTWDQGPLREASDDGPVRREVWYLEDDGGFTGISIYAIVVHPDLESARNDTDPSADVAYVETNWDPPFVVD
jgi:hypothetical protein